jgi:hypothetical protein
VGTEALHTVKEASIPYKTDGQLNWSYLVQEMLSKTCYLGKDGGKDISDGKTRNKTKLLLG